MELLGGKEPSLSATWILLTTVLSVREDTSICSLVDDLPSIRKLGLWSRSPTAKCRQNRGLQPPSTSASTCGRIAEASNPGPVRRALVQRDGNLSAVPLVTRHTLALQEKVWTGFTCWLEGELSEGASTAIFKLPAPVALFVAEYGTKLLKDGEPIHIFRHLVALTQRKILGIKPFINVCWDMVSRWEVLEPTESRSPPL